MGNLNEYELTGETARTYDIYDRDGEEVNSVTIENPQRLYCGKGHRFHRVLNQSGVMILCCAPGPIIIDDKIVGYCELSWMPKNSENPCAF
jgi:hypothetical protein